MPGQIQIVNFSVPAWARVGDVVPVGVVYRNVGDDFENVYLQVQDAVTGLQKGFRWLGLVPGGAIEGANVEFTMPGSDFSGLLIAGYGLEIVRVSDQREFEVALLEEPEVPEPDGPPPVVEIDIPTLPWYAAWLEPVLQNINTMFAAIVNYIFPNPDPFREMFISIMDPAQAVLDKIRELFSGFAAQSIETATRVYEDAQSETPEDVSALQDQARSISGDSFSSFSSSIDEFSVLSPPTTIPEAAKVARQLSDSVIATYMAKWVAALVAEGASLGQLESVHYLNDQMNRLMGLDSIASRSFIISLEESVFKKAQQYYAQLYQPELPDTNWLIQMVIKEKLTVDEFRSVMKFRGLPDNWSQLIWDAHFIAPNLGQLLTSFHRGTITFDELKQLTVLVDLDPFYYGWGDRGVDLWFDQFYRDPTIRQARYMFESGDIDVDRVRSIVKRSGLYPEYVEPMTGYLTTFEERLWRTNYLRQLGNLYGAGLRTKEQLDAEVLATGRTIEVSNWLAASEDAQRELRESKVKVAKPRLVTLSIAQDAFISGDVTESWLRGYFDEYGYEDDDVEIALDVLRERKREALEPKPVRRVLLPQSYVEKAYLNDFVDEAYMRTYFTDKGYDLYDVEIAIRVLNLKKMGVS